MENKDMENKVKSIGESKEFDKTEEEIELDFQATWKKYLEKNLPYS